MHAFLSEASTFKSPILKHLVLFLVFIDADLLHIGMRVRLCGMKLSSPSFAVCLGFKHWAAYYCPPWNYRLVSISTEVLTQISKY